jgi:hypothetical protein
MKPIPPLAGWSTGALRHVFWDKDETSFCGQAESTGRELEYGWGRNLPPDTCPSCAASFCAVRGVARKRRKYGPESSRKHCRKGHDLAHHLREMGGYWRCAECVRQANQRYYARKHAEAA